MKLSTRNSSIAALSLALLTLSAKAEEKQDYVWSSPKLGDESKSDRLDWNLNLQRPDRLTAAISVETSEEQANEDLANQLSNPQAALISMPFQNNFDWGSGPNEDGFQWKMNVQPVVPISLNDDWNLIWRTILPVISQKDIAGTPENPSGTQTGIGDILTSLWISPTAPTSSGWTWGVGSAINLKTASSSLLGTGKWGLGPTVVALKQDNGWTYGVLANHLWDVAGDSGRSDLNNTFIQPFLGYTTDDAVTYNINSESLYNWDAEQWTVPFNLTVAKLVEIGNQPVQFLLGGRYYADAPENGPKWGLRAQVTLLFPK
jgi:hypothetical protein